MPSPDPSRPSAILADPHLERKRSDRRFLALALMIVSGIFLGIVLGILVFTWLAQHTNKPPTSETMKHLLGLLAANPTDQDLREAIRSEDQRIRQQDLTARNRTLLGTYLLTLGLVGLVLAAKWYASLEPRPFVLDKSPPRPCRLSPRTRNVLAVAAVAVLLLAGFVVMAAVGRTSAPTPPVQNLAAPPPPANAITFKDNWPGFRGPSGMGLAPGADCPRSWNGQTGANVFWKVPVPLPGTSSPVLWGHRLFLTGADAKQQRVFCFDRSDGRLLWQTSVRTPESLRMTDLTVMEDTTYAAPTPVTDGKRLYVVFATADVAALDFDGKVLWARNLGKPDSTYGYASSPAFADNTLFIQFDQGADTEANLSALLALDPASGNTIWRTARPVVNSWSSPIVVTDRDRKLLITAANPCVIAYEPQFGEELWRAEGLSGDVAPSPVYADGVVYATNEGAQLMALYASGATEFATRVIWTGDEALPNAASPLCDGKRLLQAGGRLFACYDAKSGKLLWKQDIDADFYASPILVGSLVYALDRKGQMFIFPLADSYQPLATNDLGEPTDASPSIGDGFLYIRAHKNLYCIGTPPKP